MSFTKIDNSRGLSSPNVRKIVEDRYGFVWLATQDGLDRFDGLKFLHFNGSEKRKDRITNGTDFHDLALNDRKDILWAASSNGALNSINVSDCSIKGIHPLHKIVGDPAPLWYKCLFVRGDMLFAGTQQGYVFKLNANTDSVIKYANISSLLKSDAIVSKIIVGPDNLIWLFVDQKGIFILNAEMTQIVRKIPLNLPDEAIGNIFFKDALLLNNELIVATNYGIKCVSVYHKRLINNSEILKKIPDQFIFPETYAIQVDGENMYVSNGNGVFNINIRTGVFERFINSGEYNNLYWLNNVYTLSVKGSRMWLGNHQGVGWIKDMESPFTAYFSSFDGNNIRLNHCFHLFTLNDSIILSCASDGLYKTNINTAKIIRIDDSQDYYQVFKVPNGDIIASGSKKMYVLGTTARKVEAKKLYPELGKIINDFIIASICYSDSIVFLASQNKKGLYVWNIRRKTVDIIDEKTTPVFLKQLSINAFHIEENEKVLWIIGEDMISVYDLSNGTIKHNYIVDPSTNEPLSILMDMCVINQRYFLAVYGKGIIEIDREFKVKRILSSANGLSSTGLYKMYSCNDSAIIVSSNNGLFLFNLKTNKIKRISETDGVSSNSFEETSGAQIGESIFLGGLQGFTKVDLKRLKSSTNVPKIYFSNVEVDGVTNSIDTFNIFLQRVTIPNSFTRATVSFSGIYLSNPEKVVFVYRIKELHKEWINLGNQNFVSLIGIIPGNYTFQVKAANEDGVWSEPIELALIFLPKWYQTWWFKSIAALILIGLMYGAYRYRLWQIRKAQEIRQRIASDLHDDIGSTLNSVKVFTNLAIMKPENNIPYLEQLKEGVQGAIVGVRDMVWVLDDKQDTIGHLVNRIELFINPLAAAQSIVFEKSIDPVFADRMLKKEEKRNLYLIIKEALNNSIKYADASMLELRVYKAPNDKFCISIQDNGKGFDVASITRGNGLNNLQYRAQQIKYRIEIDSTPGKGTLIILTRS